MLVLVPAAHYSVILFIIIYTYVYIIYVYAANYSKLNLPVAVALYAALTEPALCALAALGLLIGHGLWGS